MSTQIISLVYGSLENMTSFMLSITDCSHLKSNKVNIIFPTKGVSGYYSLTPQSNSSPHAKKKESLDSVRSRLSTAT